MILKKFSNFFELLDKIYLFFGTLFRLYPTSKELSKMINGLLDDPNTEVKLLDPYHALVGSLCLWIENYPYAYGCVHALYTNKLSNNIIQYNLALESMFRMSLPDKKTVYRLHQVVKKLKQEDWNQQLEEARTLYYRLVGEPKND